MYGPDLSSHFANQRRYWTRNLPLQPPDSFEGPVKSSASRNHMDRFGSDASSN